MAEVRRLRASGDEPLAPAGAADTAGGAAGADGAASPAAPDVAGRMPDQRGELPIDAALDGAGGSGSESAAGSGGAGGAADAVMGSCDASPCREGGGVCEGQTCVVTCEDNGELIDCVDREVACPDDIDCRIECLDDGQCAQRITCPNNATCTVECLEGRHRLRGQRGLRHQLYGRRLVRH